MEGRVMGAVLEVEGEGNEIESGVPVIRKTSSTLEAHDTPSGSGSRYRKTKLVVRSTLKLKRTGKIRK